LAREVDRLRNQVAALRKKQRFAEALAALALGVAVSRFF